MTSEYDRDLLDEQASNIAKLESDNARLRATLMDIGRLKMTNKYPPYCERIRSMAKAALDHGEGSK